MKRLWITAFLSLVASMAAGETFPTGTVVRLAAVPAEGSVFVGWSDDVASTDNPLFVTLSADTAITATFAPVEPPPPPPPPPEDVTLTVTIVGSGSVTVEVVPNEPPPPPPPIGGFAAQIQCPDAAGIYGAPTTAIPNDPVADGCIAATVPMETFFTGPPDCSTLKPGLFYLGLYPFDDDGSITTRECYDVTDGPGFRAAALALGAREQEVMIVHNDINLTSADYAYWASKGELLVIGVPDPSGKPPRVSGVVTPFNWQITSGNLALINLMDPGEIGFGSAHLPTKQTLTLAGVTQTHGPHRLILTRYEGGGGAQANDPTLSIDDEVYFRNVLVRAGPNSHNVYLDRNGLQYIEGLISYGNLCDGCHPLKLDGRKAFLYGSWLSSAGVHDVLADDNSGQSPLSSVACQQGVFRGNYFLDAIDRFGGVAAATAQIRTAIVGCDYPQGYMSNTYPATPYTGPITYRGTSYAATPYWDPTWWAGVQARGTNPPELYANPDMLVVYQLDNTYEVLNSGTTNTESYHGAVSDPSFPVTYAFAGSTKHIWTSDAPPAEWFERARTVILNGCFKSGSPNKVANHWPGSLPYCADATAPSWLASYGACAAGADYPDQTDKFVMLGANECGTTDQVPPEVQAAVDALEAIPDPPWRHWQ